MPREEGRRRVRFAHLSDAGPELEESPSDLCNVCRSINFQKWQYENLSGYISLGRWDEIRNKSQCPFCRLVVSAFYQQIDRMPIHHDDQILLTNKLSWELGIEMSPYDRLRSSSYSNKFDLRSMSKKFNYTPFRLLAYVGDCHERYGLIQYIANSKDIENDRGQFHGRRRNRERVDINLLKSWLDRCEKFHSDTCEDDGEVSRRLPRNLRLIDVVDRCLLRAHTRDVCYLILSYVWGSDEMKRETGMAPVKLNRQDLQMTETGEERTPLPDRLPQTIEDAITLCRQLGFRYLWVDALCIIQDDAIEDKMSHLRNMDAIYNCSTLTIVAASGIHADTGLPGVSVPRHRHMPTENLGTLQMAAMSPSFTDLENSRSLVWNTRGWTFQEKIFAKRLVLFTDYQVYFRCSEAVWTEEIVMETEELSKSIESRPGKYRWAPDRQVHVPSRKLLLLKSVLPNVNVNDEWSYLGNFPDYAAAIREYSQRQLTNQDDKLIAIDGILNSMQTDAGRFFYGLPETYFLQSLLWHPEQGSRCVRETRRLPSWTWAAWCFEDGMVFDVLDIRVIRTVIMLLQHMYLEVKKVGSKLKRALQSPGGSSSTNSSSSSYDYTSSSSSTTTTSTSSPHSSTSSTPSTPFNPFFSPSAALKRDWTTLKAMQKATLNVGSCFGWPMLFPHHTVRKVFLYADGQARQVRCEQPLTMSAFTKGGVTLQGKKIPDRRPKDEDAKSIRLHNKLAPSHARPVLAMTTVVVQFFVGANLDKSSPQEDDEVGCYELLDSSKNCAGEIWTTRKQAKQGRDEALTFLTISWGLSLNKAEIAEKYIPRWDFDAAVLPQSKINMLMKACMLFEEVMNWTSAKHLSASYGLRNSESMDQQPSLTSFFDALLTAHKDEPRPKFLWSTVNLLQVTRVRVAEDGGQDRAPMYSRVGVARVIFDAWLGASSPSRDVILT